jgi:ubiquitin carboxyl-terminal hydrolase 5/13
MHKVADGLLSGRYSHPAPYASGTPSHPSDPLHPFPTPVFQQGIRPTSFKALIGKGHPEFSTMKQQDSEEFFTYLVTTLRRDLHKYQDRPDQGKIIMCPSFHLNAHAYLT